MDMFNTGFFVDFFKNINKKIFLYLIYSILIYKLIELNIIYIN